MTDTRIAMLDAGIRLYGTTAADLLKGLGAGAVAQEAGFHRQTFYRYWDTRTQYVQELLRHALDDTASPVADGVAVLPARRGAPVDLEAFARDLARMLQAMLLGLVAPSMTCDDDPHGSALLERATTTILEALTQPVATDESATG